MNYSVLSMCKGFLFTGFITILFSCSAKENKQPLVEADVPPPPVAEVGVEVETDAKTKKPVITGTLQFEPTTEDQKKYNTLKKVLQKNKAPFFNIIRSGRLSKYQSTRNLKSQEVIGKSESISTQDLKTFLTRQSLDEFYFNFEMNEIGAALALSLIENFGNSKDQGEYYQMSAQVKQLVSANVITNVEEIRAKLFQAELNSKMTPTPGNENLRIEVKEDGKVYMKQ